MTVTIHITVEDITEKLLSYDEIEIERSDSVGGSFSAITESPVSLVAGTFNYSTENVSGTPNHYFRYRFNNSITPDPSAYSPIFRPDGATRRRARQYILEAYAAGHEMAAIAAGSDANTLITADSNFKRADWSTDRGKGSWVRIVTGNRAGETAIITGTTPSTGTIEISPDLSGALADGDLIEWNWLAHPDKWDSAYNRGAARYFYVDRVPLNGIDDQKEYPLTMFPWLRTKRQVHNLYWYPSGSSNLEELEEEWGSGGKWWTTRQDGNLVSLVISPAIKSTQVLYIECHRPMPPLYNDDDSAPNVCNEELAGVLMYDEILGMMMVGDIVPTIDAQQLLQKRAVVASTLNRLFRAERHLPRPRRVPNAAPTTVARAFRGR